MFDRLLAEHASEVGYENLSTVDCYVVEFTAGDAKLQLSIPMSANENAMRVKIKNALLMLAAMQKTLLQ